MTTIPARPQQRRTEALAKLGLPTSDRAEELAISLRTFLYDESHYQKEALRKSKPEKRERLAKNFLDSRVPGGVVTQKSRFWPASGKTIDPDIIKCLADLIFLDVDKVPRRPPEDSNPAATGSTAGSSQGMQQELDEELKKAAEAAAVEMESESLISSLRHH